MAGVRNVFGLASAMSICKHPVGNGDNFLWQYCSELKCETVPQTGTAGRIFNKPSLTKHMRRIALGRPQAGWMSRHETAAGPRLPTVITLALADVNLVQGPNQPISAAYSPERHHTNLTATGSGCDTSPRSRRGVRALYTPRGLSKPRHASPHHCPKQGKAIQALQKRASKTSSDPHNPVYSVKYSPIKDSNDCLTGSLPTVAFGLAVVSGTVDSLGALVNMCKCAGRANILCMRIDSNE